MFGGMALWGCGAPAPMRPPQLVLPAEKSGKEGLNQQLLAQLPKAAQAGAAPQVSGKSSADYQVGPEDLLDIQVYGEDDLERSIRVSGAGEISMPLVGAVPVAGLTPLQIEQRLRGVYGQKFLKNPQVTVFVKEYRHQRVAVTGAVKTPGFYEIVGPRTLLEMLAIGGGLNEKAGDYVHIMRRRPAKEAKPAAATEEGSAAAGSDCETMVIDLRKLAQDGRLNVSLRGGDVVHVPYAGLAYVLGYVNKPGSVPVKENLTVSQALAMTGSPIYLLASPGNISILRMEDNGQAVTIPVNLGRVVKNQEPDILLKENDVVYVPEGKIRKFLWDFRQLMPGFMSMGYSLAP
jgi:polysaccharide export outer membrane protein